MPFISVLVTCDLRLVIVTENEPDVPVRRHVEGNERALVNGRGEGWQIEKQTVCKQIHSSLPTSDT